MSLIFLLSGSLQTWHLLATDDILKIRCILCSFPFYPGLFGHFVVHPLALVIILWRKLIYFIWHVINPVRFRLQILSCHISGRWLYSQCGLQSHCYAILLCPSYVPLRVRLRLSSGLTCTSILNAFTLLLCISFVHVQFRCEPRTFVGTSRELGNPFSLVLFSLGFLSHFLVLRGPFSDFSGQKIGVYLTVLAIHAVTEVQICNWDPPSGQRHKRKENKKKISSTFFGPQNSFFSWFLWRERYIFYLSFSCSQCFLFTTPQLRPALRAML